MQDTKGVNAGHNGEGVTFPVHYGDISNVREVVVIPDTKLEVV